MSNKNPAKDTRLGNVLSPQDSEKNIVSTKENVGGDSTKEGVIHEFITEIATSPKEQLNECSRISDSSERLACYDRPSHINLTKDVKLPEVPVTKLPMQDIGAPSNEVEMEATNNRARKKSDVKYLSKQDTETQKNDIERQKMMANSKKYIGNTYWYEPSIKAISKIKFFSELPNLRGRPVAPSASKLKREFRRSVSR